MGRQPTEPDFYRKARRFLSDAYSSEQADEIPGIIAVQVVRRLPYIIYANRRQFQDRTLERVGPNISLLHSWMGGRTMIEAAAENDISQGSASSARISFAHTVGRTISLEKLLADAQEEFLIAK